MLAYNVKSRNTSKLKPQGENVENRQGMVAGFAEDRLHNLSLSSDRGNRESVCIRSDTVTSRMISALKMLTTAVGETSKDKFVLVDFLLFDLKMD